MRKVGTLFLSLIMCLGLLSSCTNTGGVPNNDNNYNNNNNQNNNSDNNEKDNSDKDNSDKDNSDKDNSDKDNEDKEVCKHESTTKLSKAATCEESGYVEEICSKCGERIKLDTLNPLGHNYVFTREVKATCTEEGYQELTCSRCEKVQTIPLEATGHDYDSNGICKKCGKSNGSVSSKQIVINHLLSNGSGDYHYVYTSNDQSSLLAYNSESDFFITSSIYEFEDMVSTVVTGSEFGNSSNIYAMFELASLDGKETYVEAYCYVYCKNHIYDGVVNKQITTTKCIFTSEEDLKALSNLIVGQIATSLNNASYYLMGNNLPYIY